MGVCDPILFQVHPFNGCGPQFASNGLNGGSTSDLHLTLVFVQCLSPCKNIVANGPGVRLFHYLCAFKAQSFHDFVG